MAVNSWTKVFNDFVTSTLDTYGQTKEFINNYFVPTPLLDALPKKPMDGGNDIIEPIMNEDNTTVKAFAPYEQFVVTGQNVGTAAQYKWARYGGSVTISGDERRRCRGKAMVLDLVKGKMTQCQLAMADTLATDIFSTNDGTDGKSVIGLQRMVPVDPTTYSVGGIPTSDTNWRSQTQSTVAFNTSEAGEIAMSKALDDADFGMRRPTIIVTTHAVARLYETAIRGTGQTIQPAQIGDTGFARLSYRGVPIVPDRKCPSGTMYLLDLNSMQLRYDPQANFTFGQAQEDPYADVTIWKNIWSGQLTTNHRRSHAQIDTIS